MAADEVSDKPERDEPITSIQKIIENTVKSTRAGDERGLKLFILEIYGKPEGDKYFANNPEEAARFRWFSEEREDA